MVDGGRKRRRLITASLLVAAFFAATVQGTAATKKTKKKIPAAREKTAASQAPKATAAASPAIDVTNLTGELPIAAQGACVLDELTGETIYAKNAEQPFFPASTTKILTALLVIEAGHLDAPVTATDEEPKVGESSLELRPGDAFPRREMLYGLMLKSANDVAHALARDNAGSVEAFAEKMNQRARALGATNSHFMNPHGLHHPQHYTTPHDLALIARTAMQQPFFREVVGTRTHSWQGTWGLQMLTNHNRLLGMFPGCTGVKTGYTFPSQQVLVSAAQWGTREVISVVMHTDRPGIWEDSKLLLSYGFAHLPAQPDSQP
ncbi:MAG: hypothetical protein QOD99_3022 [Chthoniobacter sp.]|jgi:D-alanyl-D-alanine carboxypeptidase (penicillin-binding protein 5/6)|nr:hypothetical protein [Chthoniobacter sp.]